MLVVGLLIAGLLFRHYLDTKPDELADQYRQDTKKGLAKAADAMDRTFVSFDVYLDVFTLPKSEIRNADDFQELKRRFLPVYDETADALKRARHSIRTARVAIKKSRRQLSKPVPEARFVEDSEELDEARKARTAGKRYLRKSGVFLDSYKRFVDYDSDAVQLRRRDLLNIAEHEVDDDDSVETLRAEFSAALETEKEILDDDLKLNPPPDLEKLHDVQRESINVSIDLYEDLVTAIDDLSPTEFEAAGQTALDDTKRLGDAESDALAKFITRSKLQVTSYRLSKGADEIEKRFARLGTGTASSTAYDRDRFRPEPPPAPKPDKGGKNKKDKGNLS